MVATGGSLSPLLGAIYLRPLELQPSDHRDHCDIDYIRYADDFIIMARTRFPTSTSDRAHAVQVTDLRLQVHPDKDLLDGQKGV